MGRIFQRNNQRNFNNSRSNFNRNRNNSNRFNVKKENDDFEMNIDVKPDLKSIKKNSNYGPKHNNHSAGIKEWRIIVKNLVNDTTRNELKELFGKYGKLKEIVQLPNKVNKNEFAPFAFIQFVSKNDAEKAVKELNGIKFKERKITVKYSMDKDAYLTKKIEGEKNVKDDIKEEEDEVEDDMVADSSEDEKDIDFTDSDDEDAKVELVPKKKIKTKKASNNDDRKDLPETEDLVLSEDSDDEDEDKDDSSGEEEEDSEEDEPPTKKIKKEVKREKKEDPAVVEGRVLFLRNLPFEVDDEVLEEEMSKYGEVTLAITCKFKTSGHPTGTGFVHFKESESVDKVLEIIESDEGLILFGSKIKGHRAVPKTEATKFKKEDKKPKDKRNLYLLRASLIRPGTTQANNMSEHDQKKRAQLVQSCKKKLKLTTMFVSPTRLAIHNIPFKLTDKEFKEMCLECCGNKKAKITECRIMRNKKGVDNKGKPVLGKSKGFGFVNFVEHKDALSCLMKMNNNSKLFTDDKRPIVEFSVENHVALNLRKKRFEHQQKVQDSNHEDVEKTKAEMRKKGSKFLPKNVGEKIRHKDKKKNTVKSTRKFGAWKAAVHTKKNKNKGKNVKK